MAKTYDDFLPSVEEENMSFVTTMHSFLMENGCKVEVKEAKSGFVVSYSYTKDKKKVALMNYVFRKKGMLARVYAKHIAMYQDILTGFPEEMKKEMLKAGDCLRLNKISECCPSCAAGFAYRMDGTDYKKCRNSAFFWLLTDESRSYVEQVVRKEIELMDID